MRETDQVYCGRPLSQKKNNQNLRVVLLFMEFLIYVTRHVFNYDFPRNMEEYVHRVGRTGRAG